MTTLGARVELVGADGVVKRSKQIVSGDSYYSSNPYRVHFGLGAADQPVTERVAIECKDFDGKVVWSRATDASKDDDKLTCKRDRKSTRLNSSHRT